MARIAMAYRVRQAGRREGLSGIDRLDAVTVINLATRPDRLTTFTAEMLRLGVSRFDRFEAIRDLPGILGCSRSHAAALRRFVDHGSSAVMVCEDDARFLVSRAELDVLIDTFLDSEADVACLAYSHNGRATEPHDALFVRTTDTATMACYIVKLEVARALVTVLDEGVRELQRGGHRMLFGCDIIWKRLQREYVFLIPIRRAVRQHSGWSDVEERFVASFGI